MGANRVNYEELDNIRAGGIDEPWTDNELRVDWTI